MGVFIPWKLASTPHQGLFFSFREPVYQNGTGLTDLDDFMGEREAEGEREVSAEKSPGVPDSGLPGWRVLRAQTQRSSPCHSRQTEQPSGGSGEEMQNCLAGGRKRGVVWSKKTSV